MMHSDKLILVCGATGKQGGAVARHLLSEGWRVRILTRFPDKPEAEFFKRRGAEVVKGDMADRAGLLTAMKGAYGVFSVQNTWESGVEKEVEQGRLVATAAKEAGVKHFIYSSVGGVHRRTGIPHFESKWRIEEHIRSLNLTYSIFRPVYFMENFMMPDVRFKIYEGTLATGLRPDRPLQMIAVDDIGVFVAKAFDMPGDFLGRELELAGDELTGPQIAEHLGKSIERTVTYVQTPIEEIRKINEDLAMMYEWFNTRGFDVDIPRLREEHPGLETFDTWLVRASWKKAEQVHV